jgi:CheY-like chemotaxis protein
MAAKAESGCEVLIVDDDPDCVDALRYLLDDRGYRVGVARNGLEALQYFEAGGRPCLVILDLMMPVMDGLEFLDRRRGDAMIAATPVIVLTATDARLGARDDVVLRKPVDYSVLIDAIEAACHATPDPGSPRIHTHDHSHTQRRP